MPRTSATLDTRLREFFARFATASNTLDLDTLVGCFADPFLAADQTGARPVPRAAFLHALPERAERFAAAGIGAARLTSLDHQTLDDTYVLVRTEWNAPRLAGDGTVALSSSFLLHDDGSALRIVLYLNHQGLSADASA